MSFGAYDHNDDQPLPSQLPDSFQRLSSFAQLDYSTAALTASPLTSDAAVQYTFDALSFDDSPFVLSTGAPLASPTAGLLSFSTVADNGSLALSASSSDLSASPHLQPSQPSYSSSPPQSATDLTAGPFTLHPASGEWCTPQSVSDAVDPSAVHCSSADDDALPPTAHTKKRRARELDPQAKIERRRAQHRAVDAQRRLKEADAIDRLQRLIRQQQRQQRAMVECETEEEQSTDATGEAEAEVEDGNRRGGRLTVLESSIALIEQLTTACQRMESACNAKDAQLNRVSTHLRGVAASIAYHANNIGSASVSDSGSDATPCIMDDEPAAIEPFPSSALSVLPPRTASYLCYSDRSRTLHSPLNFFSAAICLMTLGHNGVILDMNERFLSCTAWRRSDLLHTSVDARSASLNLPVSPLVTGRPVHRGSYQRQSLRQYPASLTQADRMQRGEQRRGDSMWRCRLGDGTISEINTTMWAEHDEPVGKGELRPPDRMILVFDVEDAVFIEKLE